MTTDSSFPMKPHINTEHGSGRTRKETISEKLPSFNGLASRVVSGKSFSRGLRGGVCAPVGVYCVYVSVCVLRDFGSQQSPGSTTDSDEARRENRSFDRVSRGFGALIAFVGRSPAFSFGLSPGRRGGDWDSLRILEKYFNKKSS